MKVIFLESVEGTAQVGEVKIVKNGFARNFLLPRGLAAPAVEPYLQRAEARAVREEKRQNVLDQDAAAVAERIDGSRISFTAKVGEQGKLYGSITGLHIADEVTKLIGGEEFDHRKVLLPEAIKEVGVQPVRLRLTRNVEATIEVEVIAEGEPEESEEEAAEAADDEAASEESADVEQETASEESADVEQETAPEESADVALEDGESSAKDTSEDGEASGEGEASSETDAAEDEADEEQS